MLTQDEEKEIRDSVRRSLDNILARRAEKADTPAAPAEVERIADTKRIIGEETDKYYQQMGLVKHVSRSGQIFWVTPAEERRLSVRSRRHRRMPSFLKVDRKVALVWGASLLFVALLIVYLLSTVLPQLV